MPRKIGGKFKGKIGRKKGESTLEAEAEEKQRRAQEEQLNKLQEQRRAEELALARGLLSAEQARKEAARQRTLNLLMGNNSKKGMKRKFFSNWIIGLQSQRRENEEKHREGQWRKSCPFCGPHAMSFQGCSCFNALQETTFAMPFAVSLTRPMTGSFQFQATLPGADRFMTTGREQRLPSAFKGLSSSLPALMPPEIAGGTSLPPQTAGGTLVPPQTAGGLGTLGPAARAAKTLAAAGASMGVTLGQRTQAPQLPADFPKNPQEGVHWSSGRRCVFDPQNCRMFFSDIVI